MISPGSEATKDHGRAVITKDGAKVASVPLGQIDSVVVSSKAHLSMPLIFALLENGRQIFFVDSFGRLCGALGKEQVSLERFETQRAVFTANQNYWIRYVINEKLQAQINILKTYAKRKKEIALADIAGQVKLYKNKLMKHDDINELRGLEGQAAKCYFSGFAYILDPKVWTWTGRNRRPPRDGVNALLSYGYTLLERDLRIAIAGAGLDPRLGFFHSNNGRKDSLVYDLLEPFRQPVIDRFILKLLNLGIFTPADFELANGGCKMKLATKKRWFERYEEYLETPFQEFQGMSPRQHIRFWVEKFGLFIFDRGIGDE